nr:MAG TPA: hypothetical protein [Caudoviricetes sp.]
MCSYNRFYQPVYIVLDTRIILYLHKCLFNTIFYNYIISNDSKTYECLN